MEDGQQKNTAGPSSAANQKGSTSDVSTTVTKENNPQGHWRHWHRFANWYKNDKKKSIPLTVLFLILLLAAIPFSRYHLAGLVIKKDFSLKITDDATSAPVSGALVSLGGKMAITDGSGKATLRHVSVGNHNISVTKKYYKPNTAKILVPILRQKSQPLVSFAATGRQVKVVVSNLISHKLLAGVDIKVAGTSFKTDKNGQALLVLPAGSASQNANLSASGFNGSSVTIHISNSQIKENDFRLTPAGKIYFLSKLSGKVDVVKTNLDGTSRQTVLAGTGSENDQETVLLASRDWKFLALLARRAGSSPTLYSIDTSDDSLNTIEAGNDTFNLVGWDGHKFIYAVTKAAASDWQPGKELLKSYNAEAKTAVQLDQTTASGDNSSNYLRESFGGEYTLNNDEIVYSKNWISAYNFQNQDDIASKAATLNSIKPDGSGKKVVKSFNLATGTNALSITINMRPNKPDSVYIDFEDGVKANFFEYSNGQVAAAPSLTSTTFYSSNYPTYLLSPSGNATFWTEPRDGKNTLLVGNQNGGSSAQIATLSDYTQYGWFSDDYLLVSKNSSQLFILAKTGLKQDSEALKISDYHKPARTYPGYGGGYGGF